MGNTVAKGWRNVVSKGGGRGPGSSAPAPPAPAGDAAKLGFSVYHLPHVAVTRTHI